MCMYSGFFVLILNGDVLLCVVLILSFKQIIQRRVLVTLATENGLLCSILYRMPMATLAALGLTPEIVRLQKEITGNDDKIQEASATGLSMALENHSESIPLISDSLMQLYGTLSLLVRNVCFSIGRYPLYGAVV